MYLFKFLVCACLCRWTVADDSVVIDNTWPGGFSGYLTMSPAETLNGWKLHIKFDAAVTDLTVFSKC